MHFKMTTTATLLTNSSRRLTFEPLLNLILSPHPHCKTFGRLRIAVWQALLNVSLADLPLNGIIGTDASGFEQAHASTHYTKRTDLTIQQLNTTLLVDTTTNAALNTHVTTRRRHDTRIASQVMKRNAGFIAVLIGDKIYDDQKLRQLSRNHDIRSVIKRLEFTLLHETWNARLDSDLHHRQNVNETVNAAIKQKPGVFV